MEENKSRLNALIRDKRRKLCKWLHNRHTQKNKEKHIMKNAQNNILK